MQKGAPVSLDGWHYWDVQTPGSKEWKRIDELFIRAIGGHKRPDIGAAAPTEDVVAQSWSPFYGAAAEERTLSKA